MKKLSKNLRHNVLLGISDTYCNSSSNEVCQAVDSMTRVIKSNSGQRNKFTEGLDFASIVDWTSELRPSMKKLRQAMDGLLKTARLTHSVFRVQEDSKAAQRACNVRYRRDVCFSQAVSVLFSHYSACETKRYIRKFESNLKNFTANCLGNGLNGEIVVPTSGSDVSVNTYDFGTIGFLRRPS